MTQQRISAAQSGWLRAREYETPMTSKQKQSTALARAEPKDK